MARKRTAPRKKAAPVVYDTSDWKFYRPIGLVKVGEYRDGSVLMQTPDGKVKAMDADKFKAEYEPVKGLTKGQW